MSVTRAPGGYEPLALTQDERAQIPGVLRVMDKLGERAAVGHDGIKDLEASGELFRGERGAAHDAPRAPRRPAPAAP